MRSTLLPALVNTLLLVALPTSAATPPTFEHLKAWAPAEQVALGISVNDLVPVTLLGGEQAYLASVSYQKAPRNFWAGYLLVRPRLQRARALEDFGGHYNEITPLEPSSESQRVVLVGSAASGQGYSERIYSVVTFDGWNAKSLYRVSESDNSGHCGQLAETHCKGNTVFINVLTEGVPADKLALVVTDVHYSSPDFETTAARFTHYTKVVLLPKPQRAPDSGRQDIDP